MLEELDLENGVMRIEHSDARKWVVNRHEASKQIWLASPTLGGLHFSWNAQQQQWQLADGRALAEILIRDIGLS
jgi:iron donor protein CyaY